MVTLNLKAIAVALVQAPALLYRVGIQYLRMKRSVNKARGRFYRELIRGGIPRRQARDLADQYVSAVSLRSMMQAMRHPSIDGPTSRY
jgi:hypothetical protein